MKSTTIDRSLTLMASVVVIVFVALPLLAVSIYIAEPQVSSTNGAIEATVGVGVILRAVAQRLFRAGAANAVRLTFSTMTRTIARTAVTRTIRVFIRASAGSLAKEMAGDTQVSPRTSAAAVVYGLIGTAFSFWGVLLFTSVVVVDQLHDELGLSQAFMIFAALIPLVFLCFACLIAARIFAIRTSFLTGVDGLLIQTYFTLSGTFLPMTTDFEFHGSQRAMGYASTSAIGAMLLAFAVLHIAGTQLDNAALVFTSAMFLTYLFVYSFPVKPLLGFNIWRQSKLLWLCIFVPILAAFLFAFPQSVAALL